MFFCIVFPNGLILLKELVGIQKGEDHKKLFQSYIVPSIQFNIGNMSNLEQDNCPIHTSRSVRQCYETSNINIIDFHQGHQTSTLSKYMEDAQ